MDKVRWTLILTPEQLHIVDAEAGRLDRSRSWMLGEAWKLTMGEVLALDAVHAQALQKSTLRTPEAVASLRDGEAPDGFTTASLYLPAPLAAAIETEADRLGLSTWEILAFCIDRAMPALASMPA